MAKKLIDILSDAAVVRDETNEKANTAERVGGVLVELANYLSNFVPVSDVTVDADGDSVRLVLHIKNEDGTVSTRGVTLPAASTENAGVLTTELLKALQAADRSEAAARQEADTELLARIQGRSIYTHGSFDPIVFIGNFKSTDGVDAYTQFEQAILSTLTLTSDEGLLSKMGNLRAIVNDAVVDIHNYICNYATGTFVQAIDGHVGFSHLRTQEQGRYKSTTEYHKMWRKVVVDVTQRSLPHDERGFVSIGPWTDTGSGTCDLGQINQEVGGDNFASLSEIAGDGDITFIKYKLIGSAGGIKQVVIMQYRSGDNNVEQIKFIDREIYRRTVSGATGVQGDVTSSTNWEVTGAHTLGFDATTRKLSLKPRRTDKHAELSNIVFPDNTNLYESNSTSEAVNMVVAKPFGGTITRSISKATTAKAGVMTAAMVAKLDDATTTEDVTSVVEPMIAAEVTNRQNADNKLLKRITGTAVSESSAFTDPFISDGELISDSGLSAEDKNAIFNLWLNCYCSNSDVDLSIDEVWSNFIAADVVRLTGTHRASVDGKLVIVEQGMAATLSNHTQVITGQFKPSADGSMLLTNYSRVDTLSRVITISKNDDGRRSVTFSKWRSLQKDKAPVIVNNVFFDGNKTLLDSAADDVRGCVLYGRSVQSINPAYSLYSPSDTIQWDRGNTTFDYEFVNDTGIRVKILSTTDKTPQLSSYKNNLASKFAPINKGKIFVSLGKLTLSSNVSKVLLFLMFYKGSAVTKQIQITAASDFSKSYDITGIEFDNIRILYRFYQSKNGSFAEGDEFKLESLRIATSEDETIYKVNKCLVGSQIQIGSTSYQLPVTLRGVPNEDKWNFKYNGQKYLCDTLNLLTGKVTRWVKSEIDAQTSEAITDYSSYILSRQQVSDCQVPKSISTAYPYTDILQTPLDVSCGVSIDYTADTKSYVDIGASKDYVTPEDYGAVGDGINDDTEAIVSWLKSLTPYKVLGRKKVYKMRPIGVKITDGVTIDGNGSTLITDVSSVTPSEKSCLLTLEGSGTLRINNCSFDINARSLTGYTSLNGSCLGGISLLLFNKVYMDGCYITDTMSGLAVSCTSDIECHKCRFVALGHVTEPSLQYPNYNFGAIESSGKVVAKDCYFERVGAACIMTEQSIIMSGCNVVNSYNSTIECPLGRYDNVHVLVDNCVFDKCMGPIFNGSSQGTIHQCEQLSVSITNNVVKDFMGGSRPISKEANTNMFISYLTNAANGGSWHNASIHITGNTLSVSDHINSDEVTNTRIGIGQFLGAGDVVLQDNVIHATGNGAIINALRCVKFAGNVCKNVEDIQIKNADSVDVSDNHFCSNAGAYPIIKSECVGVNRFSIQNNTTASSSYLLYITKGCSQMILTGNVCKNLMQIVGSLTLKGVVTGNMANINLFNDASLTSQLLVTGNLPS